MSHSRHDSEIYSFYCVAIIEYYLSVVTIIMVARLTNKKNKTEKLGSETIFKTENDNIQCIDNMSKSQLASDARLKIAAAESLLIDWDGCIVLENHPLEAAIKFLRTINKPYVIISNNTTKVPHDFTRILARHGIAINDNQIFTAGCETINYAYEKGFRNIEIIGSSKMVLYAKRSGFMVSHKDTEAIILLRDIKFTYQKLYEIVNKINRGIPLIVGNADLTHPGIDGKIVPETGAIYSAISACLNDEKLKTVEFVGKPYGRLFKCAAQRLNIDLTKTVLIGDNPETDAKGAHAFGAKAILINGKTGIGFEDLI
jgi:4-nitrophenyl phosphatase